MTSRGVGTWLCLRCGAYKFGRTQKAERCLSCAHRHKERRQTLANLIRTIRVPLNAAKG